MRSIAFPNIFNNTTTNIVTDKDATMTNLKLLLGSEKGSLLGDPYFGTNLKKLLFEQNNYILRDLLIDEIYLAILNFMPQIKIDRKDIEIIQTKTSLSLSIVATNNIDFVPNLYEILLLSIEE